LNFILTCLVFDVKEPPIFAIFVSLFLTDILVLRPIKLIMKNNKSQELDENDLLHQEDIDAILNQESHGTWGGPMTAEEFIAFNYQLIGAIAPNVEEASEIIIDSSK
jgi:hypothetical protein